MNFKHSTATVATVAAARLRVPEVAIIIDDVMREEWGLGFLKETSVREDSIGFYQIIEVHCFVKEVQIYSCLRINLVVKKVVIVTKLQQLQPTIKVIATFKLLLDHQRIVELPFKMGLMLLKIAIEQPIVKEDLSLIMVIVKNLLMKMNYCLKSVLLLQQQQINQNLMVEDLQVINLNFNVVELQ